MALRKNLLKISEYDENDDILIGIVSDLPSYKVAYRISVLFDVQFVHNQYLSEEARLTFSDFTIQHQPLNKIDLEFYRYTFGEKNREILLVPNAQEYLAPQKSEQKSEGALFENAPEIKQLHLIPELRHLDYILRFSYYDNDEILDFARILIKSRIFRAIVTTQTNKVKNAATLYLL